MVKNQNNLPIYGVVSTPGIISIETKESGRLHHKGERCAKGNIKNSIGVGSYIRLRLGELRPSRGRKALKK